MVTFLRSGVAVADFTGAVVGLGRGVRTAKSGFGVGVRVIVGVGDGT